MCDPCTGIPAVEGTGTSPQERLLPGDQRNAFNKALSVGTVSPAWCSRCSANTQEVTSARNPYPELQDEAGKVLPPDKPLSSLPSSPHLCSLAAGAQSMIHCTVIHTVCVRWLFLKNATGPAEALETKLHDWNPKGCSKKTDLKKAPERWALAGPPTASNECKETQAEIPTWVAKAFVSAELREAKPHTRTRVHTHIHTQAHGAWQPVSSRAGNTSHGTDCQDKQQKEPGPVSLATIRCIWPGTQPKQCSHPPQRHRRPSVFKHTSTEP